MNPSFEEIFEAHKDRVLSLCYRYLQQKQEAEDAVQDIFVKIYFKRKAFRAEAQLSTWIYRISVNHCLDILKSNKRKHRLQQIVALLPFIEGQLAEQAGNMTIEAKEGHNNIMHCVQKLPKKQMTVLVLNKLEGLPLDKVAQIMGLSYKATESLLQRAKQNLQKQLAQAKD
jgi:RNA polymerase sigma-70 factor (ECF subfamily)